MPDLLTLSKPQPELSATSDQAMKPVSDESDSTTNNSEVENPENVDNGESEAVESDSAASEQDETTEDSATSDDDDSGEDTAANAKGKSKGVQKRIDELTRARGEAERRAQERDRQLEQAMSIIQRITQGEPQQVTQQETVSDPRPTRDDFDDPDDYTAELAAWSGREAVRNFQRQNQETTQQQAIVDAHQKAVQRWTEGRATAIEKYPDYQAVAENENVPISESVGMAILNSPNPHDVAYYLGKHPEDAQRISTLAPLQAAIEIGTISARIASEPAKEVSKAPAPVKPVGSRNTARGKSPDEESPEEYAARRRQEKGYIDPRNPTRKT